jgi:hypothetical protein
VQHRIDEVGGEFLLEIINVNLRRAGLLRLCFEAGEFVLLPDVAQNAIISASYFSLIQERSTEVSNPPE